MPTTTPLDPITFEVIRHRLSAINDDQARMGASLSGSPVVFEGYDFNAALTTGTGDGLFVGVYIMHHATGIDFFVRRVLEQWPIESIREGDMFFTNDPWWGALHPNDAILAMPIFADGRLIMWSGIVMHENDVGSPVPGSFVTGARDRFGEGPLIPGVKMVENFELRADIEAIWLRNTRTPHLNELNLRARLAALLVTHRRVHELIDRYGLDTLLAAQDRIIDYVETVLRARLREIPDGTWAARGYHDHDGSTDRVYPVHCQLTKTGDRLVVDMRGTAKQAQGPINCTRPAMEGAILGVVLMELCHDLPWSVAALRRVVEIVSEPGSLVDAVSPAPTSMASIMATLTTQDVMVHATGQMLLCAGAERRSEAHATWTPGMQGCSFITPPTGPGQEPAFAILANSFGGGGGARTFADGLDTGGMFHSMSSRIPSIETIEARGWVLHHYRRELCDSGGPGRFRGGVGIEYSVSPHKTPIPSMVGTMSSGIQVPAGRGLAGGMPGGPAGTTILRDTDVRALMAAGRLPASPAEIAVGAVDVQAPKQHSRITADDVLVGQIQGGGGYGDPLARDPESVLRDLEQGLVSAAAAREIYGVVVAEGELDGAATAATRSAIRQARRTDGAVETATIEGDLLHLVADTVAAVVLPDGERHLRCETCHTDLGAYESPYALSATTRDLPFSVTGSRATGYDEDEYLLREYACPGCGTALLHEVQARSEAEPAAALSHLAP